MKATLIAPLFISIIKAKASHRHCSLLLKKALSLGITEIFTEASITAKPHAEAKGFNLYQEQRKLHNGVEFINYLMKKPLINPSKLDIKFLADCEDHIPALAKLWYEEISRHWAPNPSIERAIQNLKNHSNKSKLPIAYVAIYDSKPVGLACLRDNDGIREGTGPWLGSLVVCPRYRGHHIGEALINAVKLKALDFDYHEIYLLAFDPTIPQWYAKLGWSSIGEDQLFGHRVEVMKIKL